MCRSCNILCQETWINFKICNGIWFSQDWKFGTMSVMFVKTNKWLATLADGNGNSVRRVGETKEKAIREVHSAWCTHFNTEA